MSDTWQELVDIDYTYDCPTDNYCDGSDVESVTENYNGPARLVALVDKETKLVEVTLREWEAYDGRPDRVNCDNVIIDCSVDALVCEVLSDYHNAHLDHSEELSDPAPENRTMKTIPTPDGYNEFTWHFPIHPDELYDSDKTTYVDGAWVLYKQTNADILGVADWTEIRTMRNGMLMNTDAVAGAPDVPAEKQDPIIAMRQKLRDLPDELKDIDSIFVPSSFPSTKILEQG
jgi:hypothetical protein